MGPNHWTILIVPPGTGKTRTYVVGQRERRVLVGAAATAGIMVLAAIIILFTPYGTPSAQLLRMQNVRLESQMAALDQRLSTLSDTLVSLGARDQQIRLLAGLPTEPAGGAGVGAETGADSTAGAVTTAGAVHATGALSAASRSRPSPPGRRPSRLRGGSHSSMRTSMS